MKRRSFLGGALGLGATALGPRPALLGKHLWQLSQSGRSIESRIDVLVNEPIGTISPEIYGHFTEHLGAVVYDGIWVGEGSRVPNIQGIRSALVDAMKRVKPAVIRWPGGCFADSYDWRDGVGPRSQRQRRTNFWVDAPEWPKGAPDGPDRKSTRLNSSHVRISYAVF